MPTTAKKSFQPYRTTGGSKQIWQGPTRNLDAYFLENGSSPSYQHVPNGGWPAHDDDGNVDLHVKECQEYPQVVDVKLVCDQATPSCSRCARLDLVCTGAGIQRFKFLEEHPYRNSHTNNQLKPRQFDPKGRTTIDIVLRSPTNEITVLLDALNAIICPSTDIRFNLSWTHGGYLKEIPARLGTSTALDAATGVLTKAHAGYCSVQGTTSDALHAYSRALRELRISLDDPTKACTVETLCATQLLLLSQSLLGLEGPSSTHARGLAQMLKVRGFGTVSDPFEAKLLAVIRGSLITEAMIGSKIRFSLEEWKFFANIPLFENSYESKCIRCLCLIPYYIDRRASSLPESEEDSKILDEIRGQYESLKPTIGELKICVSEITSKSLSTGSAFSENGYMLRMYGLSLWVASISGCLLRAVYVDDKQLRLELREYAEEMLILSRHLLIYAPFGANIIPLILAMAWVGAGEDELIKKSVEMVLDQYHTHAQTRSNAVIDRAQLESMSRKFCITKPGLVT